jgi:SSS family solute:Na+ symporter
MVCGTWMAAALKLNSSVYPLHFFGQTYAMYAAVPALVLNLAVSTVVTLVLRAFNLDRGTDSTLAEDYA